MPHPPCTAPQALAVPGPVEATREPSLRSASKSETRQAPPTHPHRALCSGWTGWHGTSPVVTAATPPPPAHVPSIPVTSECRDSSCGQDRMKLCRHRPGPLRKLRQALSSTACLTPGSRPSQTRGSLEHAVCTLHPPAGHRCRDGDLTELALRRSSSKGTAFASRSLSFKLPIFMGTEYFYVYRKPRLYFYMYRKPYEAGTESSPCAQHSSLPVGPLTSWCVWHHQRATALSPWLTPVLFSQVLLPSQSPPGGLWVLGPSWAMKTAQTGLFLVTLMLRSAGWLVL